MSDSFDDSENDIVQSFTYKKVGHIAVPYKHFILVWGGFQGPEELNTYCPTNIIWVYNTFTEIWDTKFTSEFRPRYNSGSSGLTYDDFLYVFGGMEQLSGDYIRYSNSLFRLNLNTFVWDQLYPTGEQPLPCDKGTGWVYNNKLYFFGGYGQKPTNGREGSLWSRKFSFVSDWDNIPPGLKGWNNQLVCYDPATNSWSWVETKGAPPARAACDADIIDHRVFLFGGRLESKRNNDLYVLDMITNKWSENLILQGSTSVPMGVSWHSFNAVRPNTFILFGGLLENGHPTSSWWILEVDNSLNLHWDERNMPVPLSWHKSVFSCATQELIIIGGVCASPYGMTLSDYLGIDVSILLEPRSLFRQCLQQLTNSENGINDDSNFLEILPYNIKNILKKRFTQTGLNKVLITL